MVKNIVDGIVATNGTPTVENLEQFAILAAGDRHLVLEQLGAAGFPTARVELVDHLERSVFVEQDRREAEVAALADPATTDRLEEILGEAQANDAGAEGYDAQADEEGDEKRKPSAATRIVNFARASYRFALAEDGVPFGVPLDGPRIAQPLRGRSGLRQQSARTYFDKTGRAAAQQALADAMAVLEGVAGQASREQFPLRVAQVDDTLFLDLGRPDGLTVKVTAAGWETTTSPPVVWRRTELTGELPEPTAGQGDIDRLRDLVNVSDEYWPLVLAWLVAALFPDIPHPVLLLHGEHGVAKSSATRFVAGLVDPSGAATRTAPRDVDSWVIAAAGSWTVPLDNVSTISDWLSDAICRAVTGDGLVKRALYTDGDLSVVSFRRAVILNTIDAGALRGDLADRLLAVELALIPDTGRKSEKALNRAWEQARPLALAGLLDIAARVLAVLPTITLTEKPRMADFAEVVAAVDVVMGTTALKTYLGQRENLAEDVVSSDVVGLAVQQFVGRLDSGKWEGTYAELLDVLDRRRGDDRPPKDWPKSARSLSGRVARLAPALRSVGIGVERPPRTSGARRVVLTMERGPERPSSPSRPSPAPSDLGKRDDGRDDGSDGRESTVIPTVTPLTWGNDGDDGNDGETRPLSVDDEDDWGERFAEEFDLEDGAE